MAFILTASVLLAWAFFFPLALFLPSVLVSTKFTTGTRAFCARTVFQAAVNHPQPRLQQVLPWSYRTPQCHRGHLKGSHQPPPCSQHSQLFHAGEFTGITIPAAVWRC